MERLDMDLAQYQNQISANALKQPARDDWRQQWTDDKKAALLASSDHRHALMLNIVERMDQDQMADLLLLLIQPDSELRYTHIEQTRRRLTIEAGKVAESEAEIRAQYGSFDGRGR